jgi:hypothetical protein
MREPAAAHSANRPVGGRLLVLAEMLGLSFGAGLLVGAFAQ